MKRAKDIFLKALHSRWLKYAVVAVLGVVIVGFVDDNSVWSHLRNSHRIAELEEEIAEYQERFEHDEARLEQLERDPKAIEKIARERYFMKTDEEDIFVLSDDIK